jgi:hypothetical protein
VVGLVELGLVGRGGVKLLSSFRLSILFKFIASSTLKSFKNVSLSGSVTICTSDAKNLVYSLTVLELFFFNSDANGVPSRLDNVYLNVSNDIVLLPTRLSALSFAQIFVILYTVGE